VQTGIYSIYTKSEEGKAFVHANRVFSSASWTMQFKWTKAALLSSAAFGFVRYLVRKWVCNFVFKNLNKNKSHSDGSDAIKKYKINKVL
jgi:hypothetical protein